MWNHQPETTYVCIVIFSIHSSIQPSVHPSSSGSTPSIPHSWTRPQDTWTPPHEAGALSQPGGSKPPFTGREPWPQTWRCWFSSQLLYTRLQTAPEHAGGPGSKEPTRQHCLRKAEMKSSGSRNQTPSGPWLRLEILSIKIMNRTGDEEQPCRSPTCTGNRSDLVPVMRSRVLLRSYRDCTALSRGPLTLYSRSTFHRMRWTRLNAFSKSTKHMWTGLANSHEPSSTLRRV